MPRCGRCCTGAAQQERKAARDRGRVGTTFQVGDQVMLRTKKLLDAAEVGKLRPLWEGPFRAFSVAAVAGPNTYTLTLPPLLARSSTRGRRGSLSTSTWWSSSSESTARRSAAGPTTSRYDY